MLHIEKGDDKAGLLYRLLAERYQIQNIYDEGTLRTSTLTEEEHQWPQTRPESPALVYRGVIDDNPHQPIEYLVSVHHPQRAAFRINGG